MSRHSLPKHRIRTVGSTDKVKNILKPVLKNGSVDLRDNFMIQMLPPRSSPVFLNLQSVVLTASHLIIKALTVHNNELYNNFNNQVF